MYSSKSRGPDNAPGHTPGPSQAGRLYVTVRLKRVCCSYRKLERILLKRRGRIVQKGIKCGNRETEVPIYRESDSSARECRVSVCIVPRGNEPGLIIEQNSARKSFRIRLAEAGTN